MCAECQNSIHIDKTWGAVITTLIAVLIALVAYIYVNDRNAQLDFQKAVKKDLITVNANLEVMKKVLEEIDPEIRDKIRWEIYVTPREIPSYRGGGGSSQK